MSYVHVFWLCVWLSSSPSYHNLDEDTESVRSSLLTRSFYCCGRICLDLEMLVVDVVVDVLVVDVVVVDVVACHALVFVPFHWAAHVPVNFSGKDADLEVEVSQDQVHELHGLHLLEDQLVTYL